MDKTLKCTLCAWRGTWADAQLALEERWSDARAHDWGPSRPLSIPHALWDIQRLYEEKQTESARFGMTREPACPKCGHHTVAERRTPSFHPSM